MSLRAAALRQTAQRLARGKHRIALSDSDRNIFNDRKLPAREASRPGLRSWEQMSPRSGSVSSLSGPVFGDARNAQSCPCLTLHRENQSQGASGSVAPRLETRTPRLVSPRGPGRALRDRWAPSGAEDRQRRRQRGLEDADLRPVRLSLPLALKSRTVQCDIRNVAYRSVVYGLAWLQHTCRCVLSERVCMCMSERSQRRFSQMKENFFFHYPG